MKPTRDVGGIARWPKIYTWIIPSPLGSNGPHFIQSHHEVRKFLLNLVPSEPLSLVKDLVCIENLI